MHASDDDSLQMDRSADPNDQASQVEALDLKVALRKHKLKAQQGLRLIPVGRCYNCDEEVGQGQIFCDRDCRDDYEYRERVRRNQQGG